MKKVFFSLLAILLSLTLSGCSLQDLVGGKKEKASSKSTQQSEKQIIAVALAEDEPNKALILRGIEDMAKDEDLEVKVLSAQDATSGQQSGSSGSQEKGGKDQKNQSSKGSSSESPLKDAKILIYQGGSPEILQAAQENKVPILALNELPAGVKAAGVILPNPDQAGELMAQSIAEKVSEGHVVFLQGDPGDSAAQAALAAFKRVLSKNSKITLHVISNPQGAESMAKQSLTDYLQKNPDQVKAIGAENEKLAAMANGLLKAQQLESKILLIGGQANNQSLDRMASGSQLADIDTSPYVQGVNAFQWAQKIVKKESLDISESVTGDQGEVPAKIIPVKPVTSENLAVVQKSYTKAAEAQKQETQKQDTKGQEAGSKQGSSGSSSGSNSSNSQSGGQQGSSGGQQGAGSMPQGVNKVTEKVHTEITREYLDAQGKVIGSEQSANDQVRTIPPEMLQKEMQQSKQSGGQGQESGGEKQGDAEKQDQKKQ